MAAQENASWDDRLKEAEIGRDWQRAIEEMIETVRAAAVLVGPEGLGPWEIPEMRASLIACVDRKLPVIPVLLPGAPQKPDIPLFLRLFTWVDLREGIEDLGVERIKSGVLGQAPVVGLALEGLVRRSLSTSNESSESTGKLARILLGKLFRLALHSAIRKLDERDSQASNQNDLTNKVRL